MQILRADPAHPIRKRLWQGAIALAVIVAVMSAQDIIARNTDGSHRLSLGEDFLPVYAGGQLVREGRGGELYGMQPLGMLEERIVREADLDPLAVYGPFLNPPFFAAAYVPFSMLPYRQSLTVWVWLNLLLIAGSACLMCRMLAGDGWRSWALVPLLLVVPFQFKETMYYQQNTPVSLFLLCVIVWLWRKPDGRNLETPPLQLALRGRSSELHSKTSVFTSAPFIAGVVTGLLFFKPQLALAVSIALILTRGWRALLGLSLTGLALLVFTVTTMPGALMSFLTTLPPTIKWMMTTMPYHWHQQMTPQCFWRLLLQGYTVGDFHPAVRALGWLTTGAFAVAILVAAYRYLNGPRTPAALDRLISATIVTMPLLMPYYMDYDLLLLSIPAVLLARDWIHSPRSQTRRDRQLLWTWVVFFLVMYVNPGLGRHTNINVGVILLALMSSLHIGRSLRGNASATESQHQDEAPRALAA